LILSLLVVILAGDNFANKIYLSTSLYIAINPNDKIDRFYQSVLIAEDCCIMKSSDKTVATGAMIGLLSLAMTAHPAFAGGSSGQSDSSTPTTSPAPITTGDNSTSTNSPTTITTPINSTTSTVTTPISSTTSTSTTPIQYNQQQGLQVNWSGSSNLTPPNCNGGCVFAVTRASPVTYGSGTNLEAMIGVILPIGSNDGGAGEQNRLRIEMEKYRTEHEIRIALSEKLADALENRKMERATIIAMNLAPLLGYKDYHLLLKDVSIPKPTSSKQLLGISQISYALMY
jgi:hypothetical protein